MVYELEAGLLRHASVGAYLTVSGCPPKLQFPCVPRPERLVPTRENIARPA